MSMLAERKRKQKWSLNPRGKEWSQDANKFGQKMLEKMGWQSGRGLGLKENGITEHIKISIKNDSKGMGYKETNDQWTEHETNFSSLLESLTGGQEKVQDNIKISSLEQKSQASRARVHYHKFTRGKDLSRYSEKDLANIFGRKSLQKSKKEEIKSETNIDSKDSEHTNDLLVNGGSMMDYFKKKLPTFGKINGYIVGNNGVLQKPESESETRPSFGFGFNTNNKNSESESEGRPSFGFGFNSTDSKLHKESECDAKKENKPSFVSYISDNPSKKRPFEEIEDSVLSPKKKSKKGKLKNEENNGISNPAFNPMSTPVKIQKHVLNTIEESITEDVDESMCETLSKKNKKFSLSGSLEILENNPKNKKNKDTEESIQVEENVYEVSTNKSKKKKKSKPEAATETHSNHIEENSSKVKTKDKNVLKEQVEESVKKIEKSIDNPTFDDAEDESTIVSQIKENPYEVPCKKSKKNKKKAEAEKSMDNPTFDDAEDESTNVSQINENPYEVPCKKPKKNKKKAEAEKIIDNPTFDDAEDESTNVSQINENPYEVPCKKPKKNKKKAETEKSIDNPSFDDAEDESTNVSQINENPYEVPCKKSKKNKKKAEAEKSIHDPTLNATVETFSNSHEIEVKTKKTKKSKSFEIINPNFDDTEDTSIDTLQIHENPYEVKLTEKKKKKKDKAASFEAQVEKPIDSINPYEVKKKKRKGEETGIANPALDLNNTKDEESTIIEDCDIMLNIVSTPVQEEQPTTSSRGSANTVESIKTRKSVRFSNLTQELIIPNNDDLKKMYGKKDKSKKKNKGIDNINFDQQKTNLDENIDIMAKTLDNYQAEIENDINEEKIKTATVEDFMVGEVGNPDGENEQIKEGIKLKFRYANMDTKTPFYMMDTVGAKKSYKHLIKGDILLKFKNTNLHEIKGYGAKKTNTV